MSMNLNEFINETIADIYAFKEYYKNNQLENPEQFPEELDEGQWWEMFIEGSWMTDED